MAEQQDPFGAFFDMQGEAMREIFAKFTPGFDAEEGRPETSQWAETAALMQKMWADFMVEKTGGDQATNPLDPAQWMLMTQGWARSAPAAFEPAQKLMNESMEL